MVYFPLVFPPAFPTQEGYLVGLSSPTSLSVRAGRYKIKLTDTYVSVSLFCTSRILTDRELGYIISTMYLFPLCLIGKTNKDI